MPITLTSTKVVKDFLSNTGFLFYIHRLPRVSFVVQRANLPGISLPPVMMSNPFVNVPLAGDHAQYEEFRISFKVDEDLSNYLEVYNWLKGLAKPDSFDQYAALPLEPGTGVYSDAVLIILNAQKQPSKTIVLHDLFPVSIGDLVFETNSTHEYIGVEMAFAYRSWEVQD